MLLSTNFFLNLVFILQLYEYNCQLKIFTPDDETYAMPLSNYGIDITNVTDLKFSVKACANLHVIIQKTPTVDLNTNGNYVFVLGSYNGANVEIKQAVHCDSLTWQSNSVLNCSAYESFWISWKDGDLKIGKGTVLFADEIIASSVLPLVDYKYAFLLTGWGSQGCWNVDIGTRIISYRTKVVNNNKMIQGSGIQTYTVNSKLECLTRNIQTEPDPSFNTSTILLSKPKSIFYTYDVCLNIYVQIIVFSLFYFRCKKKYKNKIKTQVENNKLQQLGLTENLQTLFQPILKTQEDIKKKLANVNPSRIEAKVNPYHIEYPPIDYSEIIIRTLDDIKHHFSNPDPNLPKTIKSTIDEDG
ncbi:hypothetical protein LOTGIDRAFT_155888 [Lottia gigantea]|uniref:Farnesoic acid O-methyl transferase domain-containing protein n=1 Tax=Lottia gigantea TaxID=225164 RepID=V3YXR9_LOTGI|nr:hypothetical protein LOTGIDRAFT_155888 [Lottia gigantea]ESO82853.1 hypothetical protein LOTGIDRAFT_155888 [Lottia gigantea]